MREILLWMFAICGMPLALAMTRLAVEGLRDLILSRRQGSLSRAHTGLSPLGPSRSLWRATRPGKGVWG